VGSGGSGRVGGPDAVGENDAVTTALNARTRSPKPDATLAEAVEPARAALVAMVGAGVVGEHLQAVAEDERVVTHLFAADEPGYIGWCWAVTVTRAPRQKVVTVNEVVLLPGDSALVAPEWLPWKDRVDAGDMGPGDLVPTNDDDLRLVPGYLVGDQALDPISARDVREVVREVGLGRERVLSIEGRDEAADRWYAGAHGPDDPIAKEAPGQCLTCGFLIRLGDPLRVQFGVCANASSPSDGHVVSYDHGCGAHSDVREEHDQRTPGSGSPYHDTLSFDSWQTWTDAEVELLH
jgi:hypothetical protein